MSRPPTSHSNNANLGSHFQQPVIDFVGRPYTYVGSQYAQPYGNSYAIGSPYHTEAYQPASIYAQAGFPGYSQLPCHQLAAQPEYVVPSYPPAPPYETDADPGIGARQSSDQIKEKINSKIDAIIEAQRSSAHEQRADQLGSQIERLTRKVQKLSSALEHKSLPPALGASASPYHQEHIASSHDLVAERLRRLAAESRLAAEAGKPESKGRDRVPSW